MSGGHAYAIEHEVLGGEGVSVTDARLGRGRILKRRERARSGRGGMARGDRRGIREDGRPDRFRGAPRGGFIRGLRVRELLSGAARSSFLALEGPTLAAAARSACSFAISSSSSVPAGTSPLRRRLRRSGVPAIPRVSERSGDSESARRVAARVGRPATLAEVRSIGHPPRLGLARRDGPPISRPAWNGSRLAEHRTACQSAFGRVLHGTATLRGANGEGDPVRHLSSDALSCPSRASSPSACLSRCVVPSRAPPRRDFTSRHPRVVPVWPSTSRRSAWC